MGKGAGTECGPRPPMELQAPTASMVEDLAQWTEALGAPPVECLEWSSRGFTIPEALAWREVRFPYGFSQERRPIKAQDAARWRASGLRPEDVHPWLERVGRLHKRGQSQLECARHWAVAYREHGLGLEDVQTYRLTVLPGRSMYAPNDGRVTLTRVVEPKKLRAFRDKTHLPSQLAGDCIRAGVGIRLARKHRDDLVAGTVTAQELAERDQRAAGEPASAAATATAGGMQ